MSYSAYNPSMKTKTFPSKRKTAKVLSLYKLEGRAEGNKYGPISLSSIIPSLFQCLVHNQINEYLSKRKLVNTYQAGFRLLQF